MGIFTGILDRSALRGLNRAGQGLADAEKGASVLGKAHAVGGKILGSTLGGGLLGGAGNAALYANNQQGIGGSFSMGDAFMTGAAGGALLGGVVGIGGARATARAAKGDVVRATARMEKATARANKRGVTADYAEQYRQQSPGFVPTGRGATRRTGSQSNAASAQAAKDAFIANNTIAPPKVAHAQRNMNTLKGHSLTGHQRIGALPKVDLRSNPKAP